MFISSNPPLMDGPMYPMFISESDLFCPPPSSPCNLLLYPGAVLVQFFQPTAVRDTLCKTTVTYSSLFSCPGKASHKFKVGFCTNKKMQKKW